MTKNKIEEAVSKTLESIKEEPEKIRFKPTKVTYDEKAELFALLSRRRFFEVLRDPKVEQRWADWQHPIRPVIAQWINKYRNWQDRYQKQSLPEWQEYASQNPSGRGTIADHRLRVLLEERDALLEDFGVSILAKIPELFVTVRLHETDPSGFYSESDLSAALPDFVNINVERQDVTWDRHFTAEQGHTIYTPLTTICQWCKEIPAWRYLQEKKPYTIRSDDLVMFCNQLSLWCNNHGIALVSPMIFSQAARTVNGRAINTAIDIYKWASEVVASLPKDLIEAFVYRDFMETLLVKTFPVLVENKHKETFSPSAQPKLEHYLLNGVRFLCLEPAYARGAVQAAVKALCGQNQKLLVVNGPSYETGTPEFIHTKARTRAPFALVLSLIEQLSSQCEKPADMPHPPSLRSLVFRANYLKQRADREDSLSRQQKRWKNPVEAAFEGWDVDEQSFHL